MLFWRKFINKYLLPIKPSPEEKKNIADELRELRNNSSFGLIIINLLWMAVNFMFQFTTAAKVTIPTGHSSGAVEESALGLSFVGLLLILLLTQVIGMLIHRLGTLQHLLAITEIKIRRSSGHHQEDGEDTSIQDAIRHIKDVLRMPAEDDPGAVTEAPEIADEGTAFGETVVGASTRRLPFDESQRLSQTIKRIGSLLDARRFNQTLDRNTSETLNTVRRRLTGENHRENLGLSKRPELPPRPRH
ncbi:uncharacterized protein LOC101864585, partial [Aplysia californica]|uniref:Uncharacterized protein LOC101864585 n=1 Tax=Aplysia californica TaxID=6500 RepID=A0ABM1AED7_APLCA